MHASRFCSRAAPGGRAPLTGRSDIFYGAEVDGALVIALRADANAGIVRRPIDVALRPDISLEWTWRVNATSMGLRTIPALASARKAITSDCASIALEFDDGRDLTWYWSAALPV